MGTLRSVNTEFWDDEYVEELPRDGKFLFLYLLTNPLANIAGAYKISRKKIRQHTEFTDAELDALLKRFESDGKVIYRDGWMFLPNFLKNQSLGGNLPKTALNLLLETPDWIQASVSKAIAESPKLTATFENLRDLVLCLKTKSLCDRTESANRREEKGSEVKGSEGGEEPPTGIEAVADELAIQAVENAFKVKLDLATQRLVREAVPPNLIARFPAFINGRAIGWTERTTSEKLSKIGYAVTDFQKENNNGKSTHDNKPNLSTDAALKLIGANPSDV